MPASGVTAVVRKCCRSSSGASRNASSKSMKTTPASARERSRRVKSGSPSRRTTTAPRSSSERPTRVAMPRGAFPAVPVRAHSCPAAAACDTGNTSGPVLRQSSSAASGNGADSYRAQASRRRSRIHAGSDLAWESASTASRERAESSTSPLPGARFSAAVPSAVMPSFVGRRRAGPRALRVDAGSSRPAAESTRDLRPSGAR